MTKKFMHEPLLETQYLFYGVKHQSRVIWGHLVQKAIFVINFITHPCYIASPLDLYTTISLTPITYVMGSKVYPESFGFTGGGLVCILPE